jgi:stage V sporulation protein D (sporulation-specific penicillin-binding protein)
MASVYAKITTGLEIVPHLLTDIKTENKTLFSTVNTSIDLKLKKETIATVNKMLNNNLNVIGNYTFIPGYEVGGKTGTAQKYDSEGKIATGKYISSFIGTFPASNPKYVLIVCVNEPSNGAYYGGVVAKPIGQKIFSSIFNIKAIPPTDSEQLENQPSIVMPNIEGMLLSDACAKLKQLGLDAMFDADGEYVLKQLPAAGTKLFLGEIVYLIVN